MLIWKVFCMSMKDDEIKKHKVKLFNIHFSTKKERKKRVETWEWTHKYNISSTPPQRQTSDIFPFLLFFSYLSVIDINAQLRFFATYFQTLIGTPRRELRTTPHELCCSWWSHKQFVVVFVKAFNWRTNLILTGDFSLLTMHLVYSQHHHKRKKNTIKINV